MGLDWWRKQQRLYPFSSNPPPLEQRQHAAEDRRSTGETKKDTERDGQSFNKIQTFTTVNEDFCCSALQYLKAKMH